MLRSKNNDLYITRGDTDSLELRVWNADGIPFIVPPVNKRSIKLLCRRQESADGIEYIFRPPLRRIVEDSKIVVEGSGIVIIKTTSDFEKSYNISDIAQITWEYDQIAEIICKGCDLVSITFGNIVYTNTDELASVLAVTVRAADADDIVLEKYLNLNANIVVNGEIDCTPYGWNKFTSYDVIEGTQPANVMSILRDHYVSGKVILGKTNDGYYHLVRQDNASETFNLLAYEFLLHIPFFHEDTANLYNHEYTYDVILYQGLLKDDTKNGFPFKQVVNKMEIISPHKFIVGGSNNV